VFIFLVFGEVGFEPLGELTTGEQDSSPTAFAFQTDVRAETDNGPFIGTAGMLLAQAEVIIQAKIGKHSRYLYKTVIKDYKLICDKLRTGKCTFQNRLL
jgi:hypothetical protein